MCVQTALSTQTMDHHSTNGMKWNGSMSYANGQAEKKSLDFVVSSQSATMSTPVAQDNAQVAPFNRQRKESSPPLVLSRGIKVLCNSCSCTESFRFHPPPQSVIHLAAILLLLHTILCGGCKMEMVFHYNKSTSNVQNIAQETAELSCRLFGFIISLNACSTGYSGGQQQQPLLSNETCVYLFRCRLHTRLDELHRQTTTTTYWNILHS